MVAIVGGGYGGVMAAKELDATNEFNVVLIDRKDYFLHNLAGLRAAVDNGKESIVSSLTLICYLCPSLG